MKTHSEPRAKRLHYLTCQDENCEKSICVDRREYEYRIARLEAGLKIIARWDFAADGRKFAGNHKLVVKEIVGIAKATLKRK